MSRVAKGGHFHYIFFIFQTFCKLSKICVIFLEFFLKFLEMFHPFANLDMRDVEEALTSNTQMSVLLSWNNTPQNVGTDQS